MNKQERVLQAVEAIIQQFGDLRNEGVVSDMWYRHIHDLRQAAWKAYYAQKEIVDKLNESL